MSRCKNDSCHENHEFVAPEGATGMMRRIVNAAAMEGLPSHRPPCLEIRPIPITTRPRDEDRAFAMAVLDMQSQKQLWLGLRSQLRAWDFDSFWDVGTFANAPRGRAGIWEDEDTARFSSSVPTSYTLCLVPDPASRVVWSGHVDGKIRAWPAPSPDGYRHSAFQPVLSWQAHRGPVLSMVMTSYGELWSGSEYGGLKAWPWEAIEKALTLGTKENHAAADSRIQRSYVDLRSRGTPLGLCGFLNWDVRFLYSSHSAGQVWSGGFYFLELWDAQARSIIKVFGANLNGDLAVTDILSLKDISSKSDREIGSSKTSKKDKEKSKGSSKYSHRRKNILKDAAELVRRVGCQDNVKRIEVFALTAEKMIWCGYSNGLLVKYDCKGRRLQEIKYVSTSIQCLMCYETKLWIGCSDGRVLVLEQDGSPRGEWLAHNSAVMDIAVGGEFLFSLAADGNVRGWHITSPSCLDNLIRSALIENESSLTRKRHLKVLAATWNVGQGRASSDSIVSWLASPASEANIVVIGLQEIEMGAGFLAMAAAKESVGIEGSTHGHWWLDAIGEILDEGTSFERIASRQLAGLLVVAWIRKDLQPYVGEVEVGAVACGFGRRIGNKGAVALKMRLFRRTICIVNCHFAAHLDGVANRNADFQYAYRSMSFTQVSTGASSTVYKTKNVNELLGTESDTDKTEKRSSAAKIVPEEFLPALADVDMIVWLGDFNYRLDGVSYEEAKEIIGRKQFGILLAKDQLRREMTAGTVFQGMREAHITFPPTYKFNKREVSQQAYDSSEKKRVPAWCDRIVYCDSRHEMAAECNLTCPVVASVVSYDACMDVNDSDHKPVRCMFNVDIALVNESIVRNEIRRLIHRNRGMFSLTALSDALPDTVVSTNSITLQDDGTTVFRVTNTNGHHALTFEVLCVGEAFINCVQRFGPSNSTLRGCFGFPRWLQVIPASGFIDPGGTVEIAVLHEDFFTDEEYMDGYSKTSWCEDERDKQVTLVVNARRCNSDESNQHWISISHEKRLQTLNGDRGTRTQRHLLHRGNSFIGFKYADPKSRPLLLNEIWIVS